MQHYVIKFVSELQQVGSFLWPVWVLLFPPPYKTDHHDITEILLKMAKNTNHVQTLLSQPRISYFPWITGSKYFVVAFSLIYLEFINQIFQSTMICPFEFDAVYILIIF